MDEIKNEKIVKRKVRNATYKVLVKFKEDNAETMEEKIKRVLRNRIKND